MNAAKASTLEKTRLVAGLKDEIEHLVCLVDELFVLAKLDFEGITLCREIFQLGELSSDMVQTFQLATGEPQVRLCVDAGAGLPRVSADLGLIERVFENLIGNALRHTAAASR